MKVEYADLTTVITVDEFCQSVFQDRALLFEKYGIEYLRSASLFFVPCTIRGRMVPVFNEHGKAIEEYTSPRSYRPAADNYDPTWPEPLIVLRQT
jgi:hypothetical protein